MVYFSEVATTLLIAVGWSICVHATVF